MQIKIYQVSTDGNGTIKSLVWDVPDGDVFTHFCVHRVLMIFKNRVVEIPDYAVTCIHNGLNAGVFGSYVDACECAAKLSALWDWSQYDAWQKMDSVPASVRLQTARIVKEYAGAKVSECY